MVNIFSVLYSPSSLKAYTNCGMLKLRKAILIKNNTNIVQPKRGRNTIFLAMIELPMSIINKAGIKAIRNANTAVQGGNDWRMVSNGRLMEETGASHQESQ